MIPKQIYGVVMLMAVKNWFGVKQKFPPFKSNLLLYSSIIRQSVKRVGGAHLYSIASAGHSAPFEENNLVAVASR